MTDTRPVIAVDIDDVIADSSESLRLLVNQRVGVELTREQYRVPGEYWGYYERVWAAHGIAERVSFDALNAEMVDDQSHVPMTASASVAVAELVKHYKLVIVTARDVSWRQATEKWLNQRFGDVFIELYFTGHRHDESYRSKGEICVELRASYLIDDNLEHCVIAREHGVQSILFGEHGWHQNVDPDQIRCRDWPAVLEYFDGQRQLQA